MKKSPGECMTWQLHGSDPTKLPALDSVVGYATQWIKWWKTLQPSWRSTAGWPLAPEVAGTWKHLAAGGEGGVFLLIMSMTWWAKAITRESEKLVFTQACVDVSWVLRNAAGIR